MAVSDRSYDQRFAEELERYREHQDPIELLRKKLLARDETLAGRLAEIEAGAGGSRRAGGGLCRCQSAARPGTPLSECLCGRVTTMAHRNQPMREALRSALLEENAAR